MRDLTTQPASSSISVPAQSVEADAPPSHHFNFHELLSELNPLQYLPVVGTIYRAVTGDTIPETAREAGSLVVSGLLGGPIGVVTNIAMLAVEKMTGIDPEKIGGEILASLGIGSQTQAAAPAVPAKMAAVAAGPVSTAWSPAQLSAYGVTQTAGGLKRGALEGADVLNDMELSRITAQQAAQSYAANLS